MKKSELEFQATSLMADLLAEDKAVKLFWELVKIRHTLQTERICRYGHKIFVSRCSHHHKELR